MMIPRMTARRSALRLALAGVAVPLASVAFGRARAETLPPVVVWKAPTCGCCGGWIRHMRDAGFSVLVHDTDDMARVKQASGVPDALQSCHTAVITEYVVEGHVPAADIKRLIAEQPSAKASPYPACRNRHPAWTSRGSHTSSSCSARQPATAPMRSIEGSRRELWDPESENDRRHMNDRTRSGDVSNGQREREKSDARP